MFDFDRNGKLVNMPKGIRCKVENNTPVGGFGFINKIFIEDSEGNYILIPESENKATVCLIDASKQNSGSLVYYVARMEGKDYRIKKVAKSIKKEGIGWVLDGAEGNIIAPSY